MSKYNLGIVKTSILANLNESSLIKNFIGLLKESQILKTELSIIDNIEKKHIVNEDLAIKYIDENINLLKEMGCTKEKFEAENAKFLALVEGVQFSNTSKKNLYENIHILIYESLSGKKPTDVNKLHDAFVFVLEYVKNNKKEVISEGVKLPELPRELVLSDFLVKRAIFEFNEKYSSILSEDELIVLKSLVKNENAQTTEGTFNTIKESTLNSLRELKSEIVSQNKSNIDVNEQREIDQYCGKIDESVKNIEKLNFDKERYMNDVLDLINLKSELSS